ncbi:MAG: glycosyltransferase [Solirubrobacterales bacterium]
MQQELSHMAPSAALGLDGGTMTEPDTVAGIRSPGLRPAMTCTIEATTPPTRIDFGEADHWRVLVTLQGVPSAYLRFPSPGAAPEGLFNEMIGGPVRVRRAQGEFIETFRRRMAAPAPEYPAPSCSVIVCTRRRPGFVSDLLDALDELDPPASEVVVVDNDPGDRDCRRIAEAAGARYLLEPRRGLNRARQAGLLAARGELVAFTDDDCIPSTSWLRSLPELFDDPTVGAVTGPGFARAVDSPAQEAREAHGSFVNGLERRHYDWTVLSPVNSGATGAGANMVFRRELLLELGEVFPAELDGGTETRSGGDLYVLYRLLAAGHRIVYDPATYVFHRHAEDFAQLYSTIIGYGVGFSAFLTKVLVEERELAALRAWWWLWQEYRHALIARLAGRADAAQTRFRREYLRGGFLGAAAWFKARRKLPPSNPPGGSALRVSRPRASSGVTKASVRSRSPGVGSVSVIVCDVGADGGLDRSLEALGRGSNPEAAREVIVVDTGQSGGPIRSAVGSIAVRRVSSDRGGQGAARNAGAEAAQGELLLFLAAGSEPGPDLVERHLLSHRASDRERVVIGRSVIHLAEQNLAALDSWYWWEQHFRRKRDSGSLTFVDVVADNLSVSREAFGRVGGFGLGFERREDWEWGIRVMQAGLEVIYEPAAAASRELRLDTWQAIANAHAEGRADAVLLEGYPFVGPSLPAWARQAGGGSNAPARMLAASLRRPRPRQWAVQALDTLERGKARKTWGRLFGLTRRAAYGLGFNGGAPHGQAMPAGGPELSIDIGSEDPIPPPRLAAPLVNLTIEDRQMARVRCPDGQWHPSLADRAASALPSRYWQRDSLDGGSAVDEGGEDLSGIAVIFGPDRADGDDRHRPLFEAAGAHVALVDSPSGNRCAALDRAIRLSAEETVALVLPGVVPAPNWLAPLLLAVRGDRVAAMIGAGLPPGSRPGRLSLVARRPNDTPYRPIGRGSQYIVFQRRNYEALGGFDPSTDALGPQGVILDFVERALDSGWVVGYREVPGLEPPGCVRPARTRDKWDRWRARGGLTYRRASSLGARRGVPLIARRALIPQLVKGFWAVRFGSPSRRHWIGTTAAFLAGFWDAARR